METIEDIFNQIQIDADNGVIYNKELYLNECKRIVKELCKEQREICKKVVSDTCYEAFGNKKITYGDINEMILNAPEPE